MTKEVRDRLFTAIEGIPENRLGEVLDFMEFVLEKERHKKEKRSVLDPVKDPILEYIGGVSHGALAKDIDAELYGEDV
jgi:hypothetical protein